MGSEEGNKVIGKKEGDRERKEKRKIKVNSRS
jgi:hypothetical protein